MSNRNITLKYSDIMIDIETLDTQPTAVILSLAVIGFDIHSGMIKTLVDKSFCINMQVLEGRTINDETLAWWQRQSVSAAITAFSGQSHLQQTLEKLKQFIDPEVRVWAKSPSFDLVILKNAFNRYGLEIPWDFRNERDVRTYIAISPLAASTEISDVKHVATYDAALQARQVIAVSKQIANNQIKE